MLEKEKFPRPNFPIFPEHYLWETLIIKTIVTKYANFFLVEST